jgi:hypothetical protein
MRLVYFLLAEGVYAFFGLIFDVCRSLSTLCNRHNPDVDDSPDTAGGSVRRRPPRPGGTGEAQARPEVEGSNFSAVP